MTALCVTHMYRLCEKKFSKMKCVTSLYKSTLADEHLQSIFKTGNTDFEPQLETCFPLKRIPF